MDENDPRVVALRGAYNFRDLGGLPIIGGGRTRSGLLFRSDALHHLERGDVDRLVEIGIKAVVDLRSSAEVESTGRGLLGDEAIGWYHLPLSNVGGAGYTPPPALAAGDLGGHYVASLDDRTEQMARVVEHLTAPESVPAVFHCTAGKDRTGMVAALVLGMVGVEPEAIDDYAATDAAMPRIVERFGAHGAPDAEDVALPAIMRAEAASMRTFLAAVDERFGGALGWARAAGIAEETVDRLHAMLVEVP
jgi:protein tyrosine/serine phosphatase